MLGANFTPERAEFIHHLIRNGGHLTEYAILCVLLWRALGTLRFFQSLDCPDGTRRLFPAAVLGAACYAASDEFHQSFYPARTASVSDVLIDTTGALLGLTLYLAAANLLNKKVSPGRKRGFTLL